VKTQNLFLVSYKWSIQEANKAYHIPKVSPGRFANPRDGSKNTSRDDEAKSSKIETKSGGSKVLPLAIYMALIAYLEKLFNFESWFWYEIEKNVIGLPWIMLCTFNK